VDDLEAYFEKSGIKGVMREMKEKGMVCEWFIYRTLKEYRCDLIWLQGDRFYRSPLVNHLERGILVRFELTSVLRNDDAMIVYDHVKEKSENERFKQVFLGKYKTRKLLKTDG
jgi:hypothetical protein